MAVIRNLVVKIAADISSLSKGLQNAQKSIQKVASTFTKAGKTLTASITAPLVALGTAAVNVSQEFEQSMANAASVAGATGEDFQRMKDIAREMGSKTVFSASQAADALYYMASAGYKVDQMADSIEATLNLASATQTDLASATEIVISTLNQFGLEANQAERVTNVFASAIGNSMASMDKLANSMGYVGPVANSLGYEIEETVGALSVLYNAGYDGSTAGTTLRQALVSLMNPSAAALKIFEELGVAYEDLNPATNKFSDIVTRLGESGLDTSQAMKIFGARGGPGMLALMSAGGDAIDEMTASITGTNKATEMASVQLDTLQGQWKILKSEIEEIAIAFGDILIPIIRQFITKYISPLTARLMGLNMGEKKQIVMIAAIAAAAGPLLIIIGKLMSGIGTIVKVVGTVVSKLGIWAVVIAAVAAAVIYLWKTNEDFRNGVIKIWEKIKAVVLKAANAIKAWWQKNGQKIKDKVVAALEKIWEITKEVIGRLIDHFQKLWAVVSKVAESIKAWWDQNGEQIKEKVAAAVKKIYAVVKKVFDKILKITEKIWTAVWKVISDVLGLIKQIWEKDGAKIVAEVKRIFEAIWTVVKSAFAVIQTAVQKFAQYLAPIWERIKALIMSLWDTCVELYESLKPVFDLIAGIIATLMGVVMGVIDGIMIALGPLLNAVIDVANGVIEVVRAICAVLRGDWSDAWEHMKNVATNIWAAIKNIFLGIWEFIKGFGEGFVQFFEGIGVNLGEIFKSIWQGVSDFFVNIWEGIKSVCGWIWDKITGLFSSIGDFFAGIIRDAFNWGKNLINNIWEGIQSAWNWVVDGIRSIGQAIADFLGFGSPTKKGPCHTADEWIPNLMDMMAEGMYQDLPEIERAATAVANSLSTVSPNREW